MSLKGNASKAIGPAQRVVEREDRQPRRVVARLADGAAPIPTVEPKAVRTTGDVWRKTR